MTTQYRTIDYVSSPRVSKFEANVPIDCIYFLFVYCCYARKDNSAMTSRELAVLARK